MEDLVCAKSFRSRLEANIAKGKLEENGISSFITADDESGMLPFSLGKAGVQLFVKAKKREEAKKVLK